MLYLGTPRGITLEDITHFLKKTIPNLKLDFFLDQEDIPNNPEVNLFFWCILSNRIEIVKIFWKLGKVNSIIQLR